MKNFLGKQNQENGPVGKKKRRRKSNGSRQKNKTGDSKVESNDSPEIPDRGKTSDITGFPSGWNLQHQEGHWYGRRREGGWAQCLLVHANKKTDYDPSSTTHIFLSVRKQVGQGYSGPSMLYCCNLCRNSPWNTVLKDFEKVQNCNVHLFVVAKGWRKLFTVKLIACISQEYPVKVSTETVCFQISEEVICSRILQFLEGSWYT